MIKHFVISLMVFMLFQYASGQHFCYTAQQFFTNDTLEKRIYTYQTLTDSSDYGCLGITISQPVWLYMKICTPGDLMLKIKDIPDSLFANLNIDYAVFGPYVSASQCPAYNEVPVVCNDYGYGGPLHDSIVLTGLNTGEYYKILLRSYGNPSFGKFQLYKTGGTATADTLCQTPIQYNYQHEFCSVTWSDTASGIDLDWEWDTLPGTQYYVLFNSLPNRFFPIDTLYPGDPSEYHDTSSFYPTLYREYEYMLMRVDSSGLSGCGTIGSPGRTFVYSGYDNEHPELSFWRPVTSQLEPIFILRGISPGNLSVIDTVFSANYNAYYYDTIPAPGTYYYSFGIKNNCYPDSLQSFNIVSYTYCDYKMPAGTFCMSTYDNQIDRYVLLLDFQGDTTNIDWAWSGWGFNYFGPYSPMIIAPQMGLYSPGQSQNLYLSYDNNSCTATDLFVFKNIEIGQIVSSAIFTQPNQVAMNFLIPENYTDTLSLILYRGADSVNLQPYDTIYPPYPVYYDNFAPFGVNYYMAGLEYANNCDTTGNYPLSFSHIRSVNVLPSGMEENVTGLFNIYPNPADDVLMIQSTNNLPIEKIRLNDVTGRVVFTMNENIGTSSYKMDISHLPPGVYIVNIDSKGTRFVGKLIVE